MVSRRGSLLALGQPFHLGCWCGIEARPVWMARHSPTSRADRGFILFQAILGRADRRGGAISSSTSRFRSKWLWSSRLPSTFSAASALIRLLRRAMSILTGRSFEPSAATTWAKVAVSRLIPATWARIGTPPGNDRGRSDPRASSHRSTTTVAVPTPPSGTRTMTLVDFSSSPSKYVTITFQTIASSRTSS